MTPIVRLLSPSDDVIARIEITGTSYGHFLGRLVEDKLPPDLRALLAEYQDIAEQSALRELDDVQARLRKFDLRVMGIPGMGEHRIRDLQVQQSGSVAFQIESQESPPLAPREPSHDKP